MGPLPTPGSLPYPTLLNSWVVFITFIIISDQYRHNLLQTQCFSGTGMHKNLPRNGSPHCTTAEEDRMLLRMCRSDGKMTVPQLKAAWRNCDIVHLNQQCIYYFFWLKKHSQVVLPIICLKVLRSTSVVCAGV